MENLNYDAQLNYLALDWLEKLNISSPSQQQIDLMERLLAHINSQSFFIKRSFINVKKLYSLFSHYSVNNTVLL